MIKPALVRYTDWMNNLPDDIMISSLSIPGTHHSVARKGIFIWMWCQSLPLPVQMLIGIRFFDIRCRHYLNSLPVYHGPIFQNCHFRDCVEEMVSFLNGHPRETIIVRIKKEERRYYIGDRCTRSFSETFLDEIQRFPKETFWLQGNIPTLEKARGKIVIIQDFLNDTDVPLGIPHDFLIVADRFNVTNAKRKWANVRENLITARYGEPHSMYLSFSSAKGLAPPCTVAKRVNPKLHRYICSERHGRFGLIAMDYPGPTLIKDIIRTNFDDA